MIIRNIARWNSDLDFTNSDIFVEGNLIVRHEDCISINDSAVIDAAGLMAIPGLVDVHLHGCNGYDFGINTLHSLPQIAAYEVQHGVTTVCPTSMTYSEELLTPIITQAAAFAKSNAPFSKAIGGLHMEGPFISPQKMGSQNPDYIRKPDVKMFRRLLHVSEHLIKLITLAPEEDTDFTFIKELNQEVAISLGHTTADYSTAMLAFSYGANHVTHLYNAMIPFSHKAPGIIGAASDYRKAYVELICDGIHVHPSAVRAAFKLFPNDHICLISDSLMSAGMPDGIYTLGGQPIYAVNHKTCLKDGTLAGSNVTLFDCLKIAVTKVGIPLPVAIGCATLNPARSIGIDSKVGSLDIGKYADILLLNQNLEIVHIINKGRLIF